MIAVGVQFGASGTVSEVAVNTLQVAVSFPSVTVTNPTASLYHGFLTTSAQSYTFDGSVTSYNANGIDLRGKTIKYLVMELLLNPLANDYELNDVTGELTINKDLVPDTYIFFEYENV